MSFVFFRKIFSLFFYFFFPKDEIFLVFSFRWLVWIKFGWFFPTGQIWHFCADALCRMVAEGKKRLSKFFIHEIRCVLTLVESSFFVQLLRLWFSAIIGSVWWSASCSNCWNTHWNTSCQTLVNAGGIMCVLFFLLNFKPRKSFKPQKSSKPQKSFKPQRFELFYSSNLYFLRVLCTVDYGRLSVQWSGHRFGHADIEVPRDPSISLARTVENPHLQVKDFLFFFCGPPNIFSSF